MERGGRSKGGKDKTQLYLPCERTKKGHFAHHCREVADLTDTIPPTVYRPCELAQGPHGPSLCTTHVYFSICLCNIPGDSLNTPVYHPHTVLAVHPAYPFTIPVYTGSGQCTSIPSHVPSSMWTILVYHLPVPSLSTSKLVCIPG